jgi:hypothetical protein
MSADIQAKGAILEAGTPKALFQIHPASGGYDVTRDGEKFLVNEVVSEASAGQLTLVLTWPATLKKK